VLQRGPELELPKFFLCLIAKVKCNPLFFLYTVPTALLPPPPLLFPFLLTHFLLRSHAYPSFMANAFLCICRHIHNPYATNVRSSATRECICVSVCEYVCGCAAMGCMPSYSHPTTHSHTLATNTCASCKRVV